LCQKVRKAIIPAAGLGTRFLPATKAQPKEMLPIVDKPSIQYIVEEASASGIHDIVIVTGRNKTSIENHFDKAFELEVELMKRSEEVLLDVVRESSNLANLYYVRQKDPKGLGHAIYCASSFIGNEPFAVLLGDNIVDSEIPCLKQLINAFNECGSTIVGVQPVDQNDVSMYGIVDADNWSNRLCKVKGIIEKPSSQTAPSNMAALGRYVITPKIFDYLKNAVPGRGGEIQLTDALGALMADESLYAYNFEGTLYDVGSKFGFLTATVELALKRDDLKDEFAKYLKGAINRFNCEQ